LLFAFCFLLFAFCFLLFAFQGILSLSFIRITEFLRGTSRCCRQNP
jgi:hypothetical protein